MEEVVGSIPTRSTSSFLNILRFGSFAAGATQDFACGLGRPQNGSSSIPTRSTSSFLNILRFGFFAADATQDFACGLGRPQIWRG
jgi:hypothetical protein